MTSGRRVYVNAMPEPTNPLYDDLLCPACSYGNCIPMIDNYRCPHCNFTGTASYITRLNRERSSSPSRYFRFNPGTGAHEEVAPPSDPAPLCNYCSERTLLARRTPTDIQWVCPLCFSVRLTRNPFPSFSADTHYGIRWDDLNVPGTATGRVSSRGVAGVDYPSDEGVTE